jgi:hypothetical protein
MSAHRAWLVYLAVAVASTAYLNSRAQLVPKWGEWYLANEGHPFVLLQVRAFLSGKLALLPHASAAGNDYNWGRGGMHTAWGLGVPILSIPLHLVGRLFGSPGFPEAVQFLILYGATALLLARALHGTSRDEPTALFASAASAGFVMMFPTFVGMVSSRFFIYELTIATGALWGVLQLSGVLALLRRATVARLAAVCAVAGFSTMIRPPLAVYGATTAGVALVVASRGGLRARALLSGVLAYAATTGLYFVGNFLRFGSPLATGYENSLSGGFVNRMTRWGLPFQKLPLWVGLKEQFATLFLLEPVGSPTLTPPAEVARYAVGERFREYYAPTYDRVVLALFCLAAGIVCWRIVRGRLWRRDRDLRGEVATVIGAWALPPGVVLFVFYAHIANLVTRYATDLCPAFAAACLCVGAAVVDAVRARASSMVSSAQLAIACAVALYISGWRGWATNLSHPLDRKTIEAQLASLDARRDQVPQVLEHFVCNGPKGNAPVHNHLEDWWYDCSYRSALAFVMPYTPCVAFTFRPKKGSWGDAENQALSGVHATGDFDNLVSCGAPRVEGDERRVTLCEPHPPRFLLDGLRLYALATIDANLDAIDWVNLSRIDSARSCP